MSGLARMLQQLGAICSGSDQTRTPLTDALIESGMEVRYDQGPNALPEPCDLVIASAAISNRGVARPISSAGIRKGLNHL